MAAASSLPSHLPRRLAGWPLVVLLGGLTGFAPLAIDMYLPAFPAIAAELGTRIGAVEFTVSIFLIGMAVGQACYGPLADRYGRRAPLLVGAVIYALAAIGCATAHSIGALLGWRLAMALGGSAGLVIARAVVRDRFPPAEVAKIFAQLMLVMGAAPILAPMLGAQLLKITGWRGIFAVLIAFAVACVAAVIFLLPESLPPEKRARGGFGAVLRRYGELLTDRHFLGYALAAGCVSGVLFAYITGAAAVFIERFGVTPQRFSLAFGANSLAIIGSAQLNRLLLRTRTLRQLLRRAYTVLVVTGALLAVVGATGWGGLPLLAVLLFATLGAVGSILPNVAALAMEPYGHAAGSASSLLGTTQYVIGGSAGALVGVLHNGTAVPMTLTIALAAAAGWIALHALARAE